MLTEVIGKPAMLEQTAEECIELAHACLKMARHLRGENKVYMPEESIFHNLAEEIADVQICIGELLDNNIVTPEAVDSEIMSKKDRMVDRLDEIVEQEMNDDYKSSKLRIYCSCGNVFTVDKSTLHKPTDTLRCPECNADIVFHNREA